MKRDIIKIDEDLCNGCGICVPNCHEGALQIIDGKIRLISELMCDGLGACIGHCPEDAITIETREADLLLAADCTAFTMGNFHSRYLKGKTLVIACPKLDNGIDSYIEKLKALIETAQVNTITVMMMEVPCCNGLLQMVSKALSSVSGKVPVKMITVNIAGKIIKEE